ncbi:MAG: 2-oxo acid dehydrogenase subunit E2 [Betaproteobacteria bacterium]
MQIEITMPELSSSMEEGGLANWLVNVGDRIHPGDVIAEIETDKATVDLEAETGGIISALLVPQGAQGVRVGAVIALISPGAESEGANAASLSSSDPLVETSSQREHEQFPAPRNSTEFDKASINNNGGSSVPFESVGLSNVRKIIARRLTEAKQNIPHIYLTIDVRLDELLALRKELNCALEKDLIKVSINDLMIKALSGALIAVPSCNVSFTADELIRYKRVDLSVAVAAPTGLITPIIFDAASKSVAQISAEMKMLSAKASQGKLAPVEYQGGTASLSNLGMYGIKHFDAVINPPQGMILAVGAGRQKPVATGGDLSVATVMSVTGSFDHRAIDGADGAQLMQAFKDLVENPLALII